MRQTLDSLTSSRSRRSRRLAPLAIATRVATSLIQLAFCCWLESIMNTFIR